MKKYWLALVAFGILIAVTACGNKDETPHGADRYVGVYNVTIEGTTVLGDVPTDVQIQVKAIGNERLQFVPLEVDMLTQLLLALTATAYGDKLVFDPKPVDLSAVPGMSGLPITMTSMDVVTSGHLVNQQDIEFSSYIKYATRTGTGTTPAIDGIARRVVQ